MSSLRIAFLGVADLLRALQGPTVFDVAVHQLSIITKTWQGPRRGDPSNGGPTSTTLTLAQQYMVRQLTLKEISSSGGKFKEGDVMMYEITPWNGVVGAGSVGYSPAQLDPTIASTSPTDKVEVIYQLTPGASVAGGPLAGNYALREGQFGDPFAYNLVLYRRRDAP